MRDGRAYLNFLSDFWVSLWQDSAPLATIYGVEAELIHRLYLQAVAIATGDFIDTLPLFREDFWHILTLDTAVRVSEPIAVEVSGQAVLMLPDGFVPKPASIAIARKDPATQKVTTTRYGASFFTVTGRRIDWVGPALVEGDIATVETNAWELPLAYKAIPFLYDRPFEPVLTMREGDRLVPRDYLVHLKYEDDRIASQLIEFTADPFVNGAMPIRDLGTSKQIVLFAPKVYIDEQDLWQLYGHMVRIFKPSSEQYRALVKGVMFVYANGPLLAPLNAGLNLAAGLPYSRTTDKVVGILYTEDPENYVIQTERGLTYKVRRGTTLSVAVGSTLKPFSTFTSDVRVVDYLSEDKWWRTTVNHIPDSLVRDLAPQQREDPDVIDRLFDEYLKFHVFGLEVKTTILKHEFNAVEEFFRVVFEVKPAYASPYTRGYFPTMDFFTEHVPYLAPSGEIEWWPKDKDTGLPIISPTRADLPRMGGTVKEEVVTAVSTIELVRDETGDAAEVWRRDSKLQLGAAQRDPDFPGRITRLKVGASRNNLRNRFGTATDQVRIQGEFDPLITIGLRSLPLKLNAKRKVGGVFGKATAEKLTIGATIEPFEFVQFSGWTENVEIVAVMEP